MPLTKQQFKKAQSALNWVKKQITKYPQQYDQNSWCGSAQCICGWLAKKEGYAGYEPWSIALPLLGLDAKAADPWLFDAAFSAGPAKIRRRARKIVSPALACEAIDAYLEEVRPQ